MKQPWYNSHITHQHQAAVLACASRCTHWASYQLFANPPSSLCHKSLSALNSSVADAHYLMMASGNDGVRSIQKLCYVKIALDIFPGAQVSRQTGALCRRCQAWLISCLVTGQCVCLECTLHHICSRAQPFLGFVFAALETGRGTQPVHTWVHVLEGRVCTRTTRSEAWGVGFNSWPFK